MSRALITDLYELNMAASYLHRGFDDVATFSLFIRELPPERGYVVAAGLEDCLDYLESFAFADEDADWMIGTGFPPDLVQALRALRFTGDVHAVPEGTVVFANEPLLEVTARLPEAQIVETYLLNRVSFQSALATKAVRCRVAAPGIELVDFALRRTQGVDAAIALARVTAIAGFAGTSNVEAARLLGLRAVGTMAHSYVQAFPGEEDAFRAFVEDLPPPYTFLVDTYDTAAGVRTAARVIAELGLSGRLAIRLDSGDLASLAFEARRVLDEAGLHHVRIFASGGLDEYRLEQLHAAGAPIDAAGVGTRLGVSADAPYLDSVYKLVQLGGGPRLKLSPGKVTLPGAKQVWRSLPEPDVLSLREEEPSPSRRLPLLEPVMRAGRRLRPRRSITEARAALERDLHALPAEALRIRAPVAPEPVVSAGLRSLAAATAAAAHGAGPPES